MSSEPDPEPVDTADSEHAEILLADPDDYHQAQRLREIHDARKNVHDTLNDIEGYTRKSDHQRQESDLAHAVTLYASELLPLIEQTDVDATLPDKLPWNNLQEYVYAMGKTDEEKVGYYSPHNVIFQHCNSILAELKPLIEEDNTDEWEI